MSSFNRICCPVCVGICTFDRDLRREELLGETATDAQGAYTITYTAGQFARAEKQSADLIVRAFSPNGMQLAASDIHFNAPAEAQIGLEVKPREPVKLSEYEQLLADLARVLEDVPPADVTEDDVVFLVRETGQDRQQITLLAEAARLARDAGLPAEALYGFARRELPLDLHELLAHADDALRGAIESAVDDHIVPARLRESLDRIITRLEQLRFERGLLVSHEFFGQLRNQESDLPLSGFTVRAVEHNTGAPPKELGEDVTDGRGQFTVLYATPRRASPAEGEESITKIRLHIFAPNGEEIHETEIEAPPSQDEVEVIRVPVPEEEDASPRLEELSADLQLDIPPALLSYLAEHNIGTLADVRKAGGLSHLEDLPVAPDSEAVYVLEAHARLSVLSADTRANAALIEADYDSVAAIARAPRSTFVRRMHGDLGDFKAARLQVEARAHTQFLNNILAGLRADHANGFPTTLKQEGIDGLFSDTCGCRDCEAAVSPMAYLAELLDYAVTYLKREDGGDEVDLSLKDLTARFHQPFGDLPASCEEVGRRIRQVRLCIEVLRRYMKANALPVEDSPEATVLFDAYQSYVVEAYTDLLTRIGTSFEELRLARNADSETRATLANRIGIPADALGGLLLDPLGTSATVEPLTEKALERLFGLADTTRDALSEGAKLGDDQIQITRWNMDSVEWNRHTDTNGTIYVRLANSASDVFRVELFRDNARTKHVASGERTSATGPVAMVTDDGSDFSARFEINFAGETDAIEIVAVPYLLSWRLRALREQWFQQDWPEDPYTIGGKERLPIIDPDVIGPDDMRNPEAGNPAFDLWLKRRAWVDGQLNELAGLTETNEEDDSIDLPAVEAIFDRMYQVVTYGAAQNTPWDGAPPPGEFSTLRDNLARGDKSAIEEAKKQIKGKLRLTIDSFTQLIATRDKAAQWVDDPRLEPVSGEELRAFLSILVQTQKQAFFPTWINEEKDQNVTLDPKAFWISVREPNVGDWPPLVPDGHPLIDPEKLDRNDLAEPMVGKQALDRLKDRNDALKAISEELHKAFIDGGFEAVLRRALGDPSPGDSLQHDLNDLHTALNGTDPDVATEARRKIEADLHVTEDDFRLLMEVKAKADQAATDPARRPTAEEIAQLVSILTTARKEKHEYEMWHAQEQDDGHEYWNTLKARLPRWRASTSSRDAWQQALLRRSETPLIDPDLVRPGDLRDPVLGDAAELRQARRDFVESLLNAFEAARQAAATPVAAFDDSFQDAVGVPATELDALEEQRIAGEDITKRLEQLHFTYSAFSYLLRIRQLADEGAPILDDEWSNVDSILVQVRKQREFATWRAAERAQGITLGPDHFKIPEPPPLVFPPPKPEPLPAWRATERARRAWQDALQSRIEQEQTTLQAFQEAIRATEEVVLPPLRDALILASDAAGDTFVERAKAITDKLLIEAQADGCQMTSRIAHAIETTQLLLWSVRTGQLQDTYQDLVLRDDDFDEAWEWIGSYETWRAAMLVFLYPENILLPSLRRWQTPAFRQLVEDTRTNTRLTPNDVCALANKYADYFRDICTLTLEASVLARTILHEENRCTGAFRGDPYQVYLFAQGGATKSIYYTRYDPEDESPHAQQFWTQVPGLNPGSTVLGAAAYAISEQERFVYLFIRANEAGAQKLVYTKFDLVKERWSGETNDLDVPKDATRFVAVVKQRNRDDEPPHLAFHIPGGGIYERYLNRAGTDWADGEWHPLISRAKAAAFTQLHAMVEPAPREYFLFARGVNGKLYYRLFGNRDDGFWRDFDPGFNTPLGAWLGAFPWPGTEYVYTFWRQGTGRQTRYLSLDRPRAKLSFNPISSIQDFDEKWLEPVTGLSLTGLQIVGSSWGRQMNLRDFLTLDLSVYTLDPLPKELGKKLSRQLILYFRVIPNGTLAEVLRRIHTDDARDYIEGLGDKLKGDDPNFGEWKLADEWIRWFTVEHLSLQQVLMTLFEGGTVAFAERDDATELIGHLEGFPGLNRIVLAAGAAPWHLSGRVAYQRTVGGPLELATSTTSGGSVLATDGGFSINDLVERRDIFVRAAFSRLNDHTLRQATQIPVVPSVSEPFEVTEQLSADDLQVRRRQIRRAFEQNLGSPASVLAYLEEAYYFVPVHLALQLQQRGHFTTALDWFRTVYDYSVSVAHRKISHYLKQEEALENGYKRSDVWWLDPLNPHAIAETRAQTYTRFTLLSLVRCFLAYADVEFARDTAESVARARTLYTTALELLDLSETKQHLYGCEDMIASFDIEVGEVIEPEFFGIGGILDEVKTALRRIDDRHVLEDTVATVQEIMESEATLSERLTDFRRAIAGARATAAVSLSLADAIEAKHVMVPRAHSVLSRRAKITAGAALVAATAGTDFTHMVAAAAGLAPTELDKAVLPWLHGATLATGDGAAPITNREAELRIRVNGVDSALARIGRFAPLEAVKVGTTFKFGFLPTVTYSFCIPPNPIVAALHLHSELNLYKLLTCRNIAGDERQLEPYAAPVNVENGLLMIGAGGEITLPGTIPLQPTVYRYPVLIERAKQLIGQAQQIEAAFLATLEKRDAEYVHLLKARQDVSLTRAGVRLQDLRMKEAEGGVRMAELQRMRAMIQADHFQNLLVEKNSYEARALDLLWRSLELPDSVSVGLTGPSASYSPSGKLQTLANIFTTMASYERREQEWVYQRDLAIQDIRIGDQQVRLAQDHVRVVGQERVIAEMQADHAQATADFVAGKFTNADLYDWMSGVLERVYSFFLQQATSMARLAESQLAFERQEVPPAIIQADYWEAPLGLEAGLSTNGTAPVRRGLTGSARLLQDVFQLDQYAFETDKRKLQLTKTFSLARLAPAEFQRFRETGVLRFGTPMELFDYDFPGHYLRLIKRVRISVIALIPPTEGIKATLSTTGLSRVVIGPEGLFQTTRVNRPPDAVALTSPSNATGLFELAPQTPEMLFPFEGMGVDTAWEFQMSKAANSFDYGTIADVLLTIEYSALNSFTYRQQVIRALDATISADRPFSFRQEFADAYYDLNNPAQTDQPMVVRFKTSRTDFPPNIEDLRIQQVVLYFARADGASFDVPVSHLYFTELGGAGSVGGGATSIDGIISTRRGNASSWTAMIGKAPFGEWELALPDTEEMKARFKDIEDILFVITYSGRTPAWPM